MKDIQGLPEAPAQVTLCSDGKYRWVYELPMMRSPVILFTVWKVLAIGFCVPYLITVLPSMRDFVKITGVFALILLGVFALSLAAYTVLAACYGWKYCVVFEMDGEGVLHAQQARQFRKAQALGAIEAMAGLAAGDPTLAGAGLLSATKSSRYSRFTAVKRVKCVQRQHLIKIDYPFSHNQVYAEGEAFDFVADYIKAHCPQAKVTG